MCPLDKEPRNEFADLAARHEESPASGKPGESASRERKQ
jgi:hypothetical protein